MNSRQDDHGSQDMEEIGKAYREAGFNDAPPARVDDLILAAAKRDAKRKFNDYLPAMAMAATIVLALGLVLRLTLPRPDLLAPADLLEPAGAPAADNEAAPTLRTLEQAAPLENIAAPAAATVPVAEDAADLGSQERAAQLEEVITPSRGSAAVAEEATTATLAPTVADVLERQGVASSAIGRMAVPAPAPCPASARGEPGRWQACIVMQIQAGMLDAARAELEALRLDYPDYSLPADITDALEQ